MLWYIKFLSCLRSNFVLETVYHVEVIVYLLFQDSTKGDDGVYLYEPHSRPINCMSFDPDNCGKLLTCSYDGTLRCCDFKSATFQEVHVLVISAEHETRSLLLILITSIWTPCANYFQYIGNFF